MRLAVDTAIALMLTLLLGGVVWYHMRGNTRLHQVETVRASLAEIREKSLLNAALDQAETGQAGYPDYPAPQWFKAGLPVNAMLPMQHPWVDLAPPGDNADHPPDPIIKSRDQAGLWYNPSNGICRARILPQFTERETLDLYNLVNGTMLGSLPSAGGEQRAPMPHPLRDQVREIRQAQYAARHATPEPPPQPSPASNPVDPPTPAAADPDSHRDPDPRSKTVVEPVGPDQQPQNIPADPDSDPEPRPAINPRPTLLGQSDPDD